MPRVAGKNGKKIKYVRFTISVPEEEANFVRQVIKIRGGDRSKVIARIIRERRKRSCKRLLSQ